MHQELSYRIVHDLKPGEVGEAEQNFLRGKVAGLELLIEFEEELREWREQQKG